MLKKTSMILTIFLLFASFSLHSRSFNPGTWKFELKTTHGTVPFIINISNTKDKFSAVLQNGGEKIPLEVKLSDTGISIPIQSFELSLELNYPQNGVMYGHLVRHNKNPKLKTPVSATWGKLTRFPEVDAPPSVDLTGKWAVTLTHDTSEKEKGVLIFKQHKNKIEGSILTPTGDYRYMEGIVTENKFMAASFDGVYNYLFTGEIIEGKIKAEILNSYKTQVEGIRDDKAALPDAYAQTKVSSLKFEFPDVFGKKVNLQDEKFKNKPVIIQIFGSWCPNCLDEMNFLIQWSSKNSNRPIEILALAFERSLDSKGAKAQLLKTYKKYQIPYTVLLAGSTSEDKPMEKLKGLKNFISFPTTIFLNKNHEVVKVHTGFSGPSTGEYYDKWKNEFNTIVDELLK
jgi:thiol-disulfide isomerase/thioredoxin